MVIIFDTNIFIADYNLSSIDWFFIEKLAEAGEFSIAIPHVVLEELQHHYELKITDFKEKIEKIKEDFKRIQISNEQFLNIDFNLNSYNCANFLSSKLKYDIIPSKNEYLPIITERAIKKIKPMKSNGVGHSDTLIWLSLLDYVEKTDDKSAIFISSNSKDFANNSEKKDKTLHNDLKEEAAKRNLNIKYYDSLNKFLNLEKSEKLKYDNSKYTDDWLIQHIDTQELTSLTINEIEQHFDWQSIEQKKKYGYYTTHPLTLDSFTYECQYGLTCSDGRDSTILSMKVEAVLTYAIFHHYCEEEDTDIETEYGYTKSIGINYILAIHIDESRIKSYSIESRIKVNE